MDYHVKEEISFKAFEQTNKFSAKYNSTLLEKFFSDFFCWQWKHIVFIFFPFVLLYN